MLFFFVYKISYYWNVEQNQRPQHTCCTCNHPPVRLRIKVFRFYKRKIKDVSREFDYFFRSRFARELNTAAADVESRSRAAQRVGVRVGLGLGLGSGLG